VETSQLHSKPAFYADVTDIPKTLEKKLRRLEMSKKEGHSDKKR
jgi:hypothetical protein